MTYESSGTRKGDGSLDIKPNQVGNLRAQLCDFSVDLNEISMIVVMIAKYKVNWTVILSGQPHQIFGDLITVANVSRN